MTVSIIMPFYKGSFFLEDALESLRQQSYRDMEVLLICDRVKEDIDYLINEYKDEINLKVHHLKGAKGVAAARNYGISLAQGKYIYFMDSDDYLYEDALRHFVENLEEEDLDIVYGKMKWTWYSRETFLAHLNSEDTEEIEDGDGEHEESDDEDCDDQEGSKDKSKVERDKDEDEDIEDEEDEIDLRRRAYYHLVSTKKSLRAITVLNIFIKRSLVIDNNIRFNEDILFLSDYPFLIQVLEAAESFTQVKEAYYIKRNHNDPINYPSLSQTKGSKSFAEYIDTYKYAISLIDNDSDLRRRIDKKILHYYSRYLAPMLHRTKRPKQRRRQFFVLHELVKDMDPDLIKSYKKYKGRLYRNLLKGDIKKSKRIVRRHLAKKKLKKILKNKKAFARFLYVHWFLKLDMKDNWVVCESFLAKNYSDSPKYIYEYIQKNYPGRYKFIWIINDRKSEIPYKHTKVKRFSIRYCYYLARSKYYVFNSRQPAWIKKREGNVFLQTWHGTPLKRLVFDIEDISSATARYKKQVYKQSRAWDYLVAPNQYSSDIFKSCFMFNKKMLETGYPRNDILHAKSKDQMADRLRHKLGIPKDKKTVLYAPTWRDDEYYGKGKYKFSLELDLKLLRERLSNDYVLLLRTHYFIADNVDVTGVEDFVYNVSKYDDIAELYLISDILITDYSSVFFDYTNLKRPMIFFMYDLEKYRDILRGFYINVEKELPGPIVFTSEEVVKAIENIDSIKKEYEDKYKDFYHKFCAWEKGDASEKVAKAVFDLPPVD